MQDTLHCELSEQNYIKEQTWNTILSRSSVRPSVHPCVRPSIPVSPAAHPPMRSTCLLPQQQQQFRCPGGILEGGTDLPSPRCSEHAGEVAVYPLSNYPI